MLRLAGQACRIGQTLRAVGLRPIGMGLSAAAAGIGGMATGVAVGPPPAIPYVLAYVEQIFSQIITDRR